MATIIAMKPSLQQSALIAEQRIAGTVVGAAVAALVLLAVDNRTALEVIVVVLVALGASIHGVNYAWYTAALGGAILIAADVPHPSNLADEGRRILFTFASVGRRHRHVPGGQLQKHSTANQHHAPAHGRAG